MGRVAGLIARRIGLSALILTLVSLTVFVGTEILPGDALDSTIPTDELIYYTEADLARMRAELGLDKPPHERFQQVFWNLVTFDFGQTIINREPVWDGIGQPLLNSLILAAAATLITPVVAIALGALAAMRPGGGLDAGLSGLTLAGYSMPDFVTANVLVIVFALWLGLAPAVLMVAENAPALHILAVSALPVAALAVGGVAYQFRLLRAGMIEALDSDWAERATLSGVPRWRLVLAHALPSALVPMLNGAAQFVAGLVSGVVVVEAVFKFPGLGLELVRAVAQREVPTVQAIAFLAAVSVIGANLAADLAVIALDPRVRRRTDG